MIQLLLPLCAGFQLRGEHSEPDTLKLQPKDTLELLVDCNDLKLAYIHSAGRRAVWLAIRT